MIGGCLERSCDLSRSQDSTEERPVGVDVLQRPTLLFITMWASISSDWLVATIVIAETFALRWTYSILAFGKCQTWIPGTMPKSLGKGTFPCMAPFQKS